MKYKQVTLLNKQEQEFNYQEITDFGRLLLRMESTNHCNFKCVFCPHPQMKRKKGFMDEKFYYNVIDQASELGFVKLDLRNFGEPLLDKRLGRLAKYANNKGLNKIYIHTNGYGLKVKKLDEWGEAGISDVNISLSPKREFSESRPGVNADRMFSCLEKVMSSDSKWKHILSVDYIRTGLSTEEEEKEFFEWLKKYNLIKRIDIELHNWAEGEATLFRQCHRLWTSVTVLWDGRVALCCLDYEGEVQMGDLNTDTLENILNNELYKEVRRNHINGKFLEKCASCNMTEVKDLGPKPSYVKIG
jgi:radical SAM protein with 4Fe4S-binding SPASM domain|tara:strand:- start:94 stop:999 length:906 start_codon:yes stop_codon:yes gene_type:complete